MAIKMDICIEVRAFYLIMSCEKDCRSTSYKCSRRVVALWLLRRRSEVPTTEWPARDLQSMTVPHFTNTAVSVRSSEEFDIYWVVEYMTKTIG